MWNGTCYWFAKMFDQLLGTLGAVFGGLPGPDGPKGGAPKVGPRPPTAAGPAAAGVDPLKDPNAPAKAVGFWGLDDLFDLPFPAAQPLTAKEGLEEVRKRLGEGPLTKKEDALAALDTLNGLSPAEQAAAMKEMDKDTFQTLLEEVPKGDRVKFESLMKNCHDPKKKLKLWQEYQKADAARDNAEAEARLGVGDDDRTKKTNLYNTLNQNDRETDSETRLLLARGDKLTEAEVNQLIARKEKERELELKYHINLSMDEKETDPAKRSPWTDADLRRLDATLSRLPPGSQVHEAHEIRHAVKGERPDEDGLTVSSGDLTRGPGALGADLAVARVEICLAPPDLNPGDCRKALNVLNTIPKEQRAEAIRRLPPADLEKIAAQLDHRDPNNQKAIEDLLYSVPGRERLEVWKAFQKAKVNRTLDEAGAKAQDNYDFTQADTLDRAQTAELAEIDEEVEHLKKRGVSGAALDDAITDLIARKDEELRLEAEYGVNLTNDTAASIAAMPEAGDRRRERRVWEELDFPLIEKQLKQLPPEHRHAVREIRRASTDYVEDPAHPGRWIPTHGAAQHHDKHCSDDPHHDHSGQIEVFDEGRFDRVLVHEIGHNVDMHRKGGISKRYYDAAGTTASGPHGTLPSQAEKFTTEDKTAWEYAKTGAADHFADHYKLAAVDPVRVYSDFIDRPNQRVDQLKAEADACTDADKKKQLTEQLAAAVKERDSLGKQFKIMREEVFGVNGEAVTAAERNLPPTADVALFREQAARCQTPAQLEELTRLHQSTDPTNDKVTKEEIARAAAVVPAGQEEAFKRDAAMCFSPKQLVNLLLAYSQGRRALDPTTGRGEWKDDALGVDATSLEADPSGP